MGQAERIKKRQRKRHSFLTFVLLVLLCVGLYYFLHTDIFDISKVKISGNQYYTVEQLKEKANVQIGMNIFEFRKSKLKKKLLKDSYIKNVTIKRKLPATILIEITERKELASISNSRKYIIIDDEGLVLRISKDKPKITQITDMTVKKAKVGKPIEVEGSSLLNDTLGMLKAAEKAEIFFKNVDTSNIMVRAHIYEQLICEGTPENLKDNIENENLQTALFEMYSKGIQRGIIKIGSDNYCSFDPNVE